MSLFIDPVSNLYIQTAKNMRVQKRSVNVSFQEKRLKKLCSEFEAIFLSFLFKQMKKTIPKSDLLEEDFAQRIYEDELYNILAEKIAEEGKFGIAKMLYRELTSIKQSREGGYYGRSK